MREEVWVVLDAWTVVFNFERAERVVYYSIIRIYCSLFKGAQLSRARRGSGLNGSGPKAGG